MSSPSDFTSCMAVADADMAEAAASRDTAVALLVRMGEIAKPRQGGPKVLLLIAKMADAPWLEGTLEVRAQADADWTMLDLFADTGSAVARIAPTVMVGVPLAELMQSVNAQPQVIAPMTLQPGAGPSRFRLRREGKRAAPATVRPKSEPPIARAPVAVPAAPKVPAVAKPAAPPRPPAGAAPRPPTGPNPLAAAKAPAAPAPAPVKRPYVSSLAGSRLPPLEPTKPAPTAGPKIEVKDEADGALPLVVPTEPAARKVTRNTAATMVRQAPVRADVKATVKVDAVVIPREAIPGRPMAPPKHLGGAPKPASPVPRDEDE